MKLSRLFERAAHWYDGASGCPHYLRDNGKAVTLADARKHGLVPGVTKVLGDLLPDHGIAEWKFRLLETAAAELEPRKGESYNSWFRRVEDAAAAEANKGRNLGSNIHEVLEGQNDDPELQEYAVKFQEWLKDKELVSQEQVVAGDGYGGRVDLVVEHPQHGRLLVDVKTQDIEPGKKPRIQKAKWLMQLAAYDLALDPQPDRWMTLIANRLQPEFTELLWEEEEMKPARDALSMAVKLWKWTKGLS